MKLEMTPQQVLEIFTDDSEYGESPYLEEVSKAIPGGISEVHLFILPVIERNGIKYYDLGSSIIEISDYERQIRNYQETK